MSEKWSTVKVCVADFVTVRRNMSAGVCVATAKAAHCPIRVALGYRVQSLTKRLALLIRAAGLERC